MEIIHVEGRGFYIYSEEGKVLAELNYIKEGDILEVDHTEVDDSLKGQGIAAKLVDKLTAHARENSYKIRPICSYVVKKFEKGDYDDIKA